MPLFILSLLDRNGLKFGYGPSMLMSSDEFARHFVEHSSRLVQAGNAGNR